MSAPPGPGKIAGPEQSNTVGASGGLNPTQARPVPPLDLTRPAALVKPEGLPAALQLQRFHRGFCMASRFSGSPREGSQPLGKRFWPARKHSWPRHATGHLQRGLHGRRAHGAPAFDVPVREDSGTFRFTQEFLAEYWAKSWAQAVLRSILGPLTLCKLA